MNKDEAIVNKRTTCRGGVVAAVLLVVAIVTAAMVCGLRNSYGASQLDHKTSVSGPTTTKQETTSHGPIVVSRNSAAALKVSNRLDAGVAPTARVATAARRALQPTGNNMPLNDNCAQAISITINGKPVRGSTVRATKETQVDDVSYVFIGNGRRVRVSTCSPDTTTAHNFVIRNGGCSSFYVSGSNSMSDGKCLNNVKAASFEFDSVNGRSYPILVYPRSPGVQGQFSIRVRDYVNPMNDYCEQAISLPINGSPVRGSTVHATKQTLVNDVSYVFVGNGRRVRVSTCFPDTTTAHNFVIRNGGCSSSYVSGSTTSSAPECTGNANAYAATFEFESVNGRSYPILVYPRSPGVQGRFAIRVSDYVNPINDYCEQAISLTINGAPVQGSTVNATKQSQLNDVSYVVVGNGRRVRVSTCFAYTTTAHNFVIRSGGCSAFYLTIASSAPDCTNTKGDTAASFEFDTFFGISYPIHVFPRVPGAWGYFAIQATSV
jgi:hypothetical protein